MKPAGLLIKLGKYILIIVVVIFFLFPIYWLFITAFKPSDEWFAWPPIFFPRQWTLTSFIGGGGGVYEIGSIKDALPYLRNSTVVGLITAALSTIVSAMAAYSISRFKTGGTKLAGWIISIRLLPPISAALPLFVIFKALKLLDTWWALILTHTLITSPLSTWILITFFNEIPKELDEAAYVDGATPLQSFFRITLPLAAPGIAAVAVLALIQSWGEFLMALVLTNSPRAQTLPIFLGRYITGWRVAWGPLAAAGLVAMLPVVVFGILMQRFLIRGLTFGAVKQ
jgi:multiple sugar transport system permease protein